MSKQTITWMGKSGKSYKYWLYPMETSFSNVPGNYMFLREVKPGRFEPIYIGESGELSERPGKPEQHHKIDCVRKHGATHVCAHKTSGGATTRRAEEADLIAKYRPQCNDQTGRTTSKRSAARY